MRRKLKPYLLYDVSALCNNENIKFRDNMTDYLGFYLTRVLETLPYIDVLSNNTISVINVNRFDFFFCITDLTIIIFEVKEMFLF